MPAIAVMRRLVPFFLCVCVCTHARARGGREREKEMVRRALYTYLFGDPCATASRKGGKLQISSRTVSSQHIRHCPFQHKKKEKKD